MRPPECPFTILVDGREKHAWQFHGMRAGARYHRQIQAVHTEWAHLKTGDYTIRGHEDRLAIERKSLADLYATLGQHRDRFEAEHERMSRMPAAFVIVEADWQEILLRPPARSSLLPKTVHRTAMAWMLRYRVPWLTCSDRRLAEITAFRLMEQYWRQQKHEQQSVCTDPVRSDRDSDSSSAGRTVRTDSGRSIGIPSGGGSGQSG